VNTNPIVADLDHATKRYGAVAALDNVTLRVRRGEAVALLGPNGAGKTTAVRLLLGLAAPTSGRVALFGAPPSTRLARERLGVMLQVAKVPETLTVREHVRLFSSYYPAPMPEVEVMALAGLTGLERRRFSALSGGERQRVLFALAICGNPDLLVLDEPTVGLDAESRRGFWREIRRAKERGCALLLTTHYLDEADALADRIVVLQRGRTIADDTPEAIKARAAHVEIRCVTALDEGQLRALQGVSHVRRDNGRAAIAVATPEATVRELLQRDPSVSGLEVSRASLEDAFLALTAEK
jgi:ABC-2 type transport system ATP-binding protein